MNAFASELKIAATYTQFNLHMAFLRYHLSIVLKVAEQLFQARTPCETFLLLDWYSTPNLQL